MITGMHRSGTSLIVKLLEQHGFFAGVKQDPNREALFFQIRNEWMLRRSGGSWDNPLPIQWAQADDYFRNEIDQRLKQSLSGWELARFVGWGTYFFKQTMNHPWGWKDPRTIFTFKFWAPFFPKAKLLLMVRNGIDVAHSLQTRQTRDQKEKKYHSFSKLKLSKRLKDAIFPFEPYILQSTRCLDIKRAFDLWHIYQTEAVKLLANYSGPKLLVRFEDLLNNPQKVLPKVFKFCELEDASDFTAELKSLNKDRAYSFVSNPKLVELYQNVKDTEFMVHFGYNAIV